MRSSIRPFTTTLLAVLLLAGCFGGASPAPSAASGSPATPSAPPSVVPATPAATPAAPSAAASAAPASAAPATPAPSDPLSGFTCDLPIHLDATVGIANIIDVRHGTHAEGYDRVVFEFNSGLPEVFIERATPPFTQDASGLPLLVDGTSFVRITLRGGTKQTSSGESSFTGPTDIRPGYPVLVHLVEGGDFEAQSTWYAGLAYEACVRVLTLPAQGGTMRLVIDFRHPGA